MPGGEGLSYYGARWYDAKLGRFLSADTIVPGPSNPQAFNRYAYVLNNPLGYTDPTGHDPWWAGTRPGTQHWDPTVYVADYLQKSAYRPYVAAKPTGRYVYTAYGAEIDMEHFGGGMYYGGLVLDRLRSGSSTIPLKKNLKAGYGLALEYQILKPVPQNQIENVALSIYLHSEVTFERWQGTFPLPGLLTETVKGSSFSNEDLVSDYLGFYAAVKYPGLDSEQALALIVSQLGGGERSDSPGPHAYTYPNGHIAGDWRIKNFQPNPKLYFSSTDTWMNVGWPSHMTIAPSNNGYWTFNGSSTVWPWD